MARAATEWLGALLLELGVRAETSSTSALFAEATGLEWDRVGGADAGVGLVQPQAQVEQQRVAVGGAQAVPVRPEFGERAAEIFITLKNTVGYI